MIYLKYDNKKLILHLEKQTQISRPHCKKNKKKYKKKTL
jgi:hypothetical protein